MVGLSRFWHKYRRIYIYFYQGGSIDHCTHVLGPVSQSSDESEYIEARTAEMALTHFSMLKNEFLNKYTGIVPKQASIIILDIK